MFEGFGEALFKEFIICRELVTIVKVFAMIVKVNFNLG